MSDFADLFGDWLKQSVVVRNPVGAGAEGTIYDPPQIVQNVMVEHKRRLVRDVDGREVLSETTLYAPGDSLAMKPGARVDLLDGSRSTVITAAKQTLDDVFDHWVVSLQ